MLIERIGVEAGSGKKGQAVRYRSKIIGLTLLLLLIGLVGTPVWLTYRQARQEGLNHALIAAIKRGDTPAGLAALKAGADPNSRDDDSKPRTFWQSLRHLFAGIWRHGKPSASQQGQTALMLALYSDLDDETLTPVLAPLIRALVARGADVHVRDGQGYTPLLLATVKEPADTVRAMLDKGADVKARYSDGFTPLLEAAIEDKSDTVKVLLTRGADVNARNNVGDTALIDAAAFGHAAVTKVLLNGGADVNIKNTAGDTALSDAKVGGYTTIVYLLKQAGAKE